MKPIPPMCSMSVSTKTASCPITVFVRALGLGSDARAAGFLRRRRADSCHHREGYHQEHRGSPAGGLPQAAPRRAADGGERPAAPGEPVFRSHAGTTCPVWAGINTIKSWGFPTGWPAAVCPARWSTRSPARCMGERGRAHRPRPRHGDGRRRRDGGLCPGGRARRGP